jgi:hypothetical protein
MNATVSTAIPATTAERTRMDWFAVAAFGLLWVLIVSRLRFEWTVNPQYGYGWVVPFLAAYIFWRRLRSAPPAEQPTSFLLPAILMIGAALSLIPVRLIQEANPDWRILSWVMAFAGLAISLGGVYLAAGCAGCATSPSRSSSSSSRCRGPRSSNKRDPRPDARCLSINVEC